jgi:predicted DCC family thiol-disulfide oxidoreductase YuxK
MISNSPPAVVLFDGVCNLCNGAVNFLIDHDPHKRLRFASLQSPQAQALLTPFLVPPDLDSILFLENGRLYSRSTAILRISGQLDGVWRWGKALLIIPAFLRDAAYKLVARNRYAWFGKRDACRIPTPDLRDRFL